MESPFTEEQREKLQPLAERFAAAVLSYQTDIDMDEAHETVAQNGDVSEVYYEMAALFFED